MQIKAPQVLAALLAASAGVTLLFWYQVTYSRRLDDDALLDALAPSSSVRQAEHGVEELTKRFEEHAPGMDRWVKLLIDASRRPEVPVRRTSAWAMQYGASRDDCASRLREMLATDTDVTAQRNAACALSRAGDVTALPVLRSMISNYTVTAPLSGTVTSVLDLSRRAEQDGLIAKLELADGTSAEASSPVPGRVVAVHVARGAPVTVGAPLVDLAPDADHAMNGAMGLALVGTREDLALLRTLGGPQEPGGARAGAQARGAIEAIERRLGGR